MKSYVYLHLSDTNVTHSWGYFPIPYRLRLSTLSANTMAGLHLKNKYLGIRPQIKCFASKLPHRMDIAKLPF